MRSIASPVDFSIDQKATSHPSAEGQIEKAPCRDSFPAVFAHCSDISVHINAEWTMPLGFHDRFERYVPPGRLMQGRDDSFFPIQRTADRCTHACDLILTSHFFNHVIDICQVFFQTRRCGSSCTPQDVSLVIRCRNHDLCPTDVQSNEHCHS